MPIGVTGYGIDVFALVTLKFLASLSFPTQHPACDASEQEKEKRFIKPYTGGGVVSTISRCKAKNRDKIVGRWEGGRGRGMIVGKLGSVCFSSHLAFGNMMEKQLHPPPGET